MSDLVSIITPSYNSSKFINECINSVISQTYMNWEMIIVDDCSTDNSRKKILELSKSDNRIKLIELKDNIGPALSRNEALNVAKGKYIAFLDADDIWKSDKLEKQINFMKSKNIGFSFTAYQPVSEDAMKKYPVILAPEKISYHSYLKNTIIGCLTVVINREIVGDFKMPNIRTSQDMALWLIILKRGFIAYGLQENLAYYRIVSSSNTSDKWKAALGVWIVYRKIEKLSIIYSIICFICYTFNAIKKRI